MNYDGGMKEYNAETGIRAYVGFEVSTMEYVSRTSNGFALRDFTESYKSTAEFAFHLLQMATPKPFDCGEYLGFLLI